MALKIKAMTAYWGSNCLEEGSVELSGMVRMFCTLFGWLVTWTNVGHICLNSLTCTLRSMHFTAGKIYLNKKEKEREILT